MTITSSKIAPGYYTAFVPVVLHFNDGSSKEHLAVAEIFKRDDDTGWSFTLNAGGHRLSECEDIYTAKKHVLEFFNSHQCRDWKFETLGGLNCWCLGR